jgi:hypothetical protein
MPRKLTPHNALDFVRPANVAMFNEWLESRPECVRKLANEYPIGSVVQDQCGDDWYVVGWDESDRLVISPIWIGEDYDGAMGARRLICAGHIRGGEAPLFLYHPDGTPDVEIREIS